MAMLVNGLLLFRFSVTHGHILQVAASLLALLGSLALFVISLTRSEQLFKDGQNISRLATALAGAWCTLVAACGLWTICT